MSQKTSRTLGSRDAAQETWDLKRVVRQESMQLSKAAEMHGERGGGGGFKEEYEHDGE